MGFLNHLHVYPSKNSTIAAQSITRHPRKAKQTGRPNQPFVRVHLHPNTAWNREKAAGTVSSGLWPISPHTGQSSQLSLDANERNAQFLATLAGSSQICHSLPSCKHRCVSAYKCRVVTVEGHTGQSSQLVVDGSIRPMFMATLLEWITLCLSRAARVHATFARTTLDAKHATPASWLPRLRLHVDVVLYSQAQHFNAFTKTYCI